MAIAAGFSKTVTDGLILGYDTADLVNSFRGKPTTNVFTHYGTSGFGAAANNNVTFQVNGNGTFVRLGWGQTFGDYTIKPEDVVYRYDLGANGCHYHGSTATISAGQYAIMSADYYLSPDVVVENSQLLVFENYGGSAVGGSTNLPDTTPGKWHRITLVSGPAGGSGTQASFLYPGACGPRMSAQGYILMKNPQVEFSSSPDVTPFVNGTRTATRSILDVKQTYNLDVTNMSFASPGDMVFDGTDDFIDTNFGVNDSLTQVTYEAVIFDTKNNSGYRAIIQNNVASDDALYIQPGNNLGFWPCTTTYLTVPANRWVHVVYSYDGTTMRYSVNGAQHAFTGTCADCLDFDFLRIGAHSAGDGERFGGRIAVAKVYNRALSEKEIDQNFSHYATRFGINPVYRYFEGADATNFVNNWNDPTIFSMAQFGGLGPATAHGFSSGPVNFTLTLPGLGTHSRIRYRVKWHLVDSLDNETSRLFIGDGSSEGEVLTFTKVYNAAPNVSYAASPLTTSWSGHQSYSYRPWGNGVYGADGYLDIDSGWINHTSSTLTVRHLMGADQAQADEAMYLTHVEVLTAH